MHRYLSPVLFRILLPALFALLAGASAVAQDEPAAGEARPAEQAADEPSTKEPADEPRDKESADDDSDLDDGSYSDAEEKDFVPSEDIPADQAIPFPTDI